MTSANHKKTKSHSASKSAQKPVQAYPVRGTNFFDADKNLQKLLDRYDPKFMSRNKADLSSFGGFVGGKLDEQAEYSDRFAPPKLKLKRGFGIKTITDAFYKALRKRVTPYAMKKHADRPQERGTVEFNPRYEDCHQETYARGIIGKCYGNKPEPHMRSFVMGYMLSQADISIHCPVTMTGAVAYVIDRVATDKVKKEWLHEATRMDHKTKTGGTWATELHGGSDVGRTTTVAEQDKNDKSVFRLKGVKWFTSNASSGLAVATARPDGAEEGGKGLGLYLVPSHLKNGKQNDYVVRRLKEKLGTKALATAELDLEGTWAVEIAPPPHGLKAMMEALEYSRIHNAVSGAGVQRRAVMEALGWTGEREAFGNKIIDYPMNRDRILDLMANQEADTALAFTAAKAFDDSLADEAERPWLRISTALAKYRTAEHAVHAAKAAMELTGGNGYTEEFPTARLYRDAMVLPVWEGPPQIQALELLRMLAPTKDGTKNGGELYLERVWNMIDGDLPDELADAKAKVGEALYDVTKAFKHLAKNPADAQKEAEKLLILMADTMAGALIVQEAAEDAAKGDMRKTLVANRFVDNTFNAHKKIGAGPDPAQRHFNKIIANEKITKADLKAPARPKQPKLG